MSRSPVVRAGVGLAAMLAFVTFALLSSQAPRGLAIQAGGALAPVPGQPVALPPGLVGLEIALGLNNALPPDWEGEIQVSEGRVLSIEVLQGAPGAQVNGAKFAVKAKAKGKAKVAKKKQAAPGARPVLQVTLDAPASATVTAITSQGRFAFALADVALGSVQRFLDGNASVERQDGAVRLTGPDTEDDFPAIAKAPDGTVWMAYVEYKPDRARLNQPVAPADFDAILVPKHHGDRIRLMRFDGKLWQPPIDVTGPELDVWRPTVAIDGQGAVCVAWSQRVDGDWEIFERTFDPPRNGASEGRWSDAVRLTRAPGTDFHVVSATDSKGDVWLAWQAWRNQNYEILAAKLNRGTIEPQTISESPANDWSPAIAADQKGGVYVVWDTYDKGNYDVRLRAIDRASAAMTVAGSPRFEGRPSVVCDNDGRVWVAYEEGDEQWGKDYASSNGFRKVGFAKNPGFALYVNRTVKVKCLIDGKLMQISSAPADAFGDARTRGKSVPRLAVDSAGGLWLFLRQHPFANGAGEVWNGYALRYDGKAWSAPRKLANSSNLIDNRPALVPFGSAILAVYSSDRRVNTQNRDRDDLFAALVGSPNAPVQAPTLVTGDAEPQAELPVVHPDEPADLARLRDFRLEIGGKTLRLSHGEFHRHTEVSSHNDQDGLLEDSWRYALDAASHDWMGNGDHDNGSGHEYMWWIIQKVTDLHHNPPRFVAAQTYERSVVYPNGHRNVMMPVRGIRPLPRGNLEGTPDEGSPDTKLLYEYLKHFGGMCASHTSATSMGTDCRDNDPTVEPVVEIYQGHRHNYEHFGAPRSPTAETQIGGYEPAGFIWNALAKGYRLGFQSSSDHVSTHWSYAVVLAEDNSRQAIIDAFKARHSYAATDNIVLVVRSGDHLMGDAFTSTARPSLEISAYGTTPISRLHVIRDNKYVFSTEPKKRDVKLRYTDDDKSLEPGQTSYYYVRIEQADGNLAWGSPMWITYQP
jgi:hypothetical protein